ncbi:general secretion pathway protein GspB [Pseudomonas stutzeri]|nr:general secretion pathway protein GspB [Stutzerimonas stutzeri]
MINERVLRQGESPAPGIVLERIASDGVVLSFAGYRFRPPR